MRFHSQFDRHLCSSIVSFFVTVLVHFIFSTSSYFFYFFFFNDTATTEIYTLSLHDALPIWEIGRVRRVVGGKDTPELIPGREHVIVVPDVRQELDGGGVRRHRREDGCLHRQIGRAHV